MPAVSWENALARRIAALSRDRSILIVECRIPAATLRDKLRQTGTDLDHVFILDVAADDVSRTGLVADHEARIGNPALLELIASRTARIIREKAERAATVVVDDAPCFAQYAPAEALAQIVHHAVTQLLREGNDQEYVVPPGHADDKAVQLVRPLMEEWSVESDGSLAPWPRPPP